MHDNEEHVACYENSAQELEEMNRIEEKASITDHVDWYSEQNFGVNNLTSIQDTFHYRK